MNVSYPYVPEGRQLKYVPADHPAMRAAAEAQQVCAGDPLWPVGIVAVRDGQVVARAGNGFNRGHQENHICPRIVLECKSGEGYELCSLHDPEGHSEPMLVKACRDAGVDTNGLDAYMYGHWWACEPCWKALIDAGFRDLYVTDDAHERFTKEKVYGKTLAGSVKTVCAPGADHEFVKMLRKACQEIGCQVVEEGEEVRVLIDGSSFRILKKGSEEPVYAFECDNTERACRMLKQIFRQL